MTNVPRILTLVIPDFATAGFIVHACRILFKVTMPKSDFEKISPIARTLFSVIEPLFELTLTSLPLNFFKRDLSEIRCDLHVLRTCVHIADLDLTAGVL